MDSYLARDNIEIIITNLRTVRKEAQQLLSLSVRQQK